MIYLDNAATSFPKPISVRKALEEAVVRAGNPGRGSHSAAIWSATGIYKTRESLATFFNIDDPLRIAFTLNATHSLNIADGAFVSAYNGGIVDFTVSERKTTDGYLINNISLIKGTPTYTITVSAIRQMVLTNLLKVQQVSQKHLLSVMEVLITVQ
jgi:hypothetical protein